MDNQSQRTAMSRSNGTNGNNDIPNEIDQGENSQDGASLGESKESERENVDDDDDDDDVFGSLLSWEDEDLRSISVSDNTTKGNLPNTVEPARADGEDESSNKGYDMESHGNLSRNQVLDIMFGFAPPPLAASEVHNEAQPRVDQLQQSTINQAMATKRAGNTNNECASISSSAFSCTSSSLDLVFPQLLQQHQYLPPQSFFAVPQQGMRQSQDVQTHLTTSPMMNASLASMPQSMQQSAFNQGFHLPNSVINVLGGQQDQQQQGSPILGPGNPCLSSLPMQVMQFSKQVPLVLLPSQQDLQLQADSEPQDRIPHFPLPQMIQQNPVLAVMLPGQNAVAVPQQDMWKMFQQKTTDISQWLTPSMQPCPQPNSVIPSNILVPGSDGAQKIVMASPGESYALPVQQEPVHPVQRKRPSLPDAPANEEKIEKEVRNDSEPSQPLSHAMKNDSSNSLQQGRYGRGRGRYFVKTLLPLISDLTSDSKSARSNPRTKNIRMSESALGLSNADLLDTSLKDKLMKPTFTQETLSRPAKISKHGGKSIPQSSKISSISTSSSNRRKSTSLAHEATLAMNVAKEEEQKEKLVTQQKEQLKQSAANMMQSTFPIVSNDEMSDTSFRRQVLSDSELMGHASRIHPSLNLMGPPPPSNSSVGNSCTTWNVTNPALDTAESTTSKPHKVEKRANISKKQTELSPQNDQVDQEKKMLTSSSLHDAISSSETDGGLTTDAEKECSNCPVAEQELSEGERSRLHRDRNKEHARNTRLRKKAYVEKLRATVDDLCRERDSLVQDRATSASRLLEQQKIRIDVLLAYFALRRQCERRRDLWAGVCEESVICTLPITPYRSFPAYEVQASKLQRTIQGIDGLIADTVSFHVLLDSLIDFNSVFNPRSPYYALHAAHTTPQNGEGSPIGVTPPPLLISSASPKIQVQYTVITEDACPGGSQIMARWTMVTLNAVALGAPFELTNNCMVCAKFSSANKIVSLDHVFDGLAFMLQLMPKSSNKGQMLPSTLSPQNTGLPTDLLASSNPFKVVPNTVQVSQRNYDVPMVLTLAERPYTIMQVNSLWEEMTGFKAEKIVGKANARILQPRWQQIPNFPAPYQDPALSFLMMEVRMKRAATATLINVNAQGDMFRNVLQVYPLCTDGKVTHYLGLTIFKQSLGINWNAFTRNPVNFQQVVQPLIPAPILSSGSIDLMPISVQSRLSRDRKENDLSQGSHAQPDEAKIRDGIVLE